MKISPKCYLIIFIIIILLCSCNKNEILDKKAISSPSITAEDNSEIDSEYNSLKYVMKALPLLDDVQSIVKVRECNSILYICGYSGDYLNKKTILYSMDLSGSIKWSYVVDLDYLSENFDENESISYYDTLVDYYPDGTGVWMLLNRYVKNSENRFAYSKSFIIYIYNDESKISIKERIIVDCISEEPLYWVVDDDKNCFYFVSLGNTHHTSIITCLDYNGECLISLTENNSCFHPCITNDGSFIICEIEIDNEYILKTLDISQQELMDKCFINTTIGRLSRGVSYDLIYTDGNYKTLYGLDVHTGESTTILQLLDYGFGIDLLEIIDLGEQNYLLACSDRIVMFSLSDEIAMPTYTVLTLATFDYDLTSQEVIDFNNSQNEYKIRIKDYSIYNIGEDNTLGLDQLNLDIMSGEIPDIYDLKGLPIAEFISHGLLEDLNPYIDEDKTINRTDYLKSFLSAMETDNRLYALIPNVSILAIAVNPKILDKGSILTFKEMIEIADGRDPFGGSLTRTEFIQYMLSGNNSPFLDWHSGTCNFDSYEFLDLLEFAKLLPEECQWDDEQNAVMSFEFISSDSPIIDASARLGCIENIENCAALFGLPGDNGMSYLIYPGRLSWGISAQSANKEGAWCFVRQYLLENYQFESPYGLPLLESAWDLMEEAYYSWIDAGGNFVTVDSDISITSGIYFDELRLLATNCNGIYEDNVALMDIICSEAQGFFAGIRSAEDTAKNIQSRASLYMSEQG